MESTVMSHCNNYGFLIWWDIPTKNLWCNKQCHIFWIIIHLHHAWVAILCKLIISLSFLLVHVYVAIAMYVAIHFRFNNCYISVLYSNCNSSTFKQGIGAHMHICTRCHHMMVKETHKNHLACSVSHKLSVINIYSTNTFINAKCFT